MAFGERDAYFHADNCTGQNKNNAMIVYFMWRILTKRHTNITYSFLVGGHTKFSPDWCFGLFKRLYRRTPVSCLADVAAVVNICNLQYSPVGLHRRWLWTSRHVWLDILLCTSCAEIHGIKKYHHFGFASASPSWHCFCQKLCRYKWDTALSPEIHLVARSWWTTSPNSVQGVKWGTTVVPTRQHQAVLLWGAQRYSLCPPSTP